MYKKVLKFPVAYASWKIEFISVFSNPGFTTHNYILSKMLLWLHLFKSHTESVRKFIFII
jgi:hypothetical protein